MLKIWISRQKGKKLPMGVAGPIFKLHPSNLVRNHIFNSCKSAEILVRISQVILDLAKSVWSVLSISSDVLVLIHFKKFLTLEAKACSDRPVSTLSTMVPLSGDGPVTFRAQTRHTSTGNSLRLRTTSSWKSPFRHFPFT